MNFIKNIFKSEFVKHATTLLSANLIAQLIAIAVYPIVTRIYSPEDFGEFTLFLSISSVLSILATGRYEPAIILPKKDEFGKSLFQLCLLINVVLFIILFPTSVFLKRSVAVLFDSQILDVWLPLIPVLVLLTGTWQALNYYLSRQKKFKQIGIYNVNQSSLNSGLKYILGVMDFLKLGLILATIFGQFLALIISILSIKDQIKLLFVWNKSHITYVAQKFQNFPKFQLPHALLNIFSSNLPILLLSVYFNKGEIGLFSLAITMSFRPINMFCNSIYQVMYQKVTEKFNGKEKIMPIMKQFIYKSAIAFAPLFIGIFYFSEMIFGLFFGDEWAGSGKLLQPMLPWLLLVLLVSSLSFVPNVFEKQKYALYIEIIYIIFRLLALGIGIYLDSFYLSIVLYSVVSALVLLGQLIWFFFIIKKFDLVSCNKYVDSDCCI